MPRLLLLFLLSVSVSAYAGSRQEIGIYTVGDLDIYMYSKTSNFGDFAEVRLRVPQGLKIIGGGARVETNGDGHLLTASYPLNERVWVASSKAHFLSSPGQITAYVFAARIPNRAYKLIREISGVGETPSHTTMLPNNFKLVGGGAKVNWREHGQYGNLLISSHPKKNGWSAQSKAHMASSPASITVSAIGLRRRFLKRKAIKIERTKSRGPKGEFANGGCRLSDPDGVVVSGGARNAMDSRPGSLLYVSAPSLYGNGVWKSGWEVRSKAHMQSDPRSIKAFCLGLVDDFDDDFTNGPEPVEPPDDDDFTNWPEPVKPPGGGLFPGFNNNFPGGVNHMDKNGR